MSEKSRFKNLAMALISGRVNEVFPRILFDKEKREIPIDFAKEAEVTFLSTIFAFNLVYSIVLLM